MSIAQRFGKNLLRARKRLGVSQEELAVRASLHRTEIGLLERGERLARIDTAIKLAGALGVPLDHLIHGIAWTPGRTERGLFVSTSREGRYAETMERAATVRAGQTKTVDAAKLIRESREELERRGMPDEPEAR